MRTTASFGPVRRTEAAYTYNLPMATLGARSPAPEARPASG